LCRVKFAVGLVDRTQQFAEDRRIFDGPGALERGTQSVQVVPGKQADGYDAILGQDSSVANLD